MTDWNTGDTVKIGDWEQCIQSFKGLSYPSTATLVVFEGGFEMWLHYLDKMGAVKVEPEPLFKDGDVVEYLPASNVSSYGQRRRGEWFFIGESKPYNDLFVRDIIIQGDASLVKTVHA